jgi:hypothetical protein
MKLRFACKAAFLLVVALMVAVMVAAPASATESPCGEPWNPCPEPSCGEPWNPCPEPPDSPDNDGGNKSGNNDGNRPHNQRHDKPDNNSAPALTQEFDQEAESGDVDQSFNVSQTGDNSNQTVGIQGVANTGNAQNQIGLIQFGSDADDFEFDDVASSIEVSPTNRTLSNQQVNQVAVAG